MTTIPEGFCQCGCGQRTKISKRTHQTYGWVRGKPLRFIRYHRIRYDTAERFWGKVDKRGPDECWPWLAQITTRGYGAFWMPGGATTASRMAYELTNGPLPKGFMACHTCDNPPCCNPHHIFAGTSMENNHDMIRKQRNRYNSGDECCWSKVSSAIVIQIRRRHANGEKQSVLADEYGLARSQVNRIIKRTRWKHVG